MELPKLPTSDPRKRIGTHAPHLPLASATAPPAKCPLPHPTHHNMRPLLLILLTATTAACTSDGELLTDAEAPLPQQAAIGFHAQSDTIDNGTRAINETTTSTLSTFHVSAWRTNPSVTTPAYFLCTPYSKRTYWESATPYYWPVSGGLEFLAYYPPTLFSTTNPRRVVGYDTQTGPANDPLAGSIGHQYDPVVAYAAGDIRQYDFGRTPVPLNFKHLLMAIRLTLKQQTNTAYRVRYADAAIVGLRSYNMSSSNSDVLQEASFKTTGQMGSSTSGTRPYRFHYVRNASASPADIPAGSLGENSGAAGWLVPTNGTPINVFHDWTATQYCYTVNQYITPATAAQITSATESYSSVACPYIAILMQIRTDAGAWEFPYSANVVSKTLSGHNATGFAWVAFPMPDAPAISGTRNGHLYNYTINIGSNISAAAENIGIVPGWPAPPTNDTHFPAGAKVLGTAISYSVTVDSWPATDYRDFVLNSSTQ